MFVNKERLTIVALFGYDVQQGGVIVIFNRRAIFLIVKGR